MSYDEWKKEKKSTSDSINKQDKASYKARSKAIKEYSGNKMAVSNGNKWPDTNNARVTKQEIKEIKQYAEKRGVYIQDMKEFDGDKKLFMSQIDSLSRWKEEMPINKGMSLNVAVLDDDDFGVTGIKAKRGKGRDITINAKALRDRNITENNINRIPNQFASIKTEDIVAHEYGHVYANVYNITGQKSIEIAQQALYNIGIEESADSYLEKNISEYSIEITRVKTEGKVKEYEGEEINSEIFARHNSRADAFTTEYLRLLKKEVSRR